VPIGTTKQELAANFSKLWKFCFHSPKGNHRAAIALLSAVFVVGFEQIVSWKYGATGIIGLLLLTVGIKAKTRPSVPSGPWSWPAVTGPAL